MESSNDGLIILLNLMEWDKRPDKEYLVGLPGGWSRENGERRGKNIGTEYEKTHPRNNQKDK